VINPPNGVPGPAVAVFIEMVNAVAAPNAKMRNARKKRFAGWVDRSKRSFICLILFILYRILFIKKYCYTFIVNTDGSLMPLSFNTLNQ
jgi:hypothetical protein